MPIDLERLRASARTAGLDEGTFVRNCLREQAEQSATLAAPFEDRVRHHEREREVIEARADATETGAPVLVHLKAQLELHSQAAASARATAEEHRADEREALDALAELELPPTRRKVQ